MYLGEFAQHLIALTPEVSVRVVQVNPRGSTLARGSPVRMLAEPDDVVILDD
jgi:hypothetical protein